MTNHNSHWNERDNKHLCKMVNDYLNDGESPDYEMIGQKIGRTARACSDQWKKVYKRKIQAPTRVVNWDKEINERLEQDIRLRNRWVELDEIIRSATEERAKIQAVLRIGEVE